MDFGLIALIVVGAGKVLDYVAPRTKNTVDDKIRAVFQHALGLLPFVKPDLAKKVDEAKAEPPVEMARTAPKVEAKPVKGFGMARDHRSK